MAKLRMHKLIRANREPASAQFRGNDGTGVAARRRPSQPELVEIWGATGLFRQATGGASKLRARPLLQATIFCLPRLISLMVANPVPSQAVSRPA